MSDEYVRPVLQIAGTVIGGIYGGPWGAAIGGSIGSAIGAEIAPANVGEGPRIDELKLNGSSYGRPIPLVYGTQNRIAGTIVWYGGLNETREDREVSKGNEVTTYSYSTSLCIALCEGPVSNITKIWANGKILWQGSFFADDVVRLTALESEADTNATALEAEAAACGLASDPNCADIYERSTAARAQADALDAALTAATNAQTDYDAGLTAWSFSSSLAPGATFRFYPGTMTQGVDPTIEAAKGTGNATAFPGIALLVIDGLQLEDFGNRIPNIEVEVASPNTTLRDALIDVNQRSGLVDYDYSVSLLLDQTVDGYVIASQMSTLQAYSTLESAFFFDSVEQWGQIRHVKRGLCAKATVDPGDMAARNNREGVEQPILTERRADQSLPEVATITYRDPERDYQPNTQRAQRGKGASDNIINVDFGITMTNAYARQVVDRMLWEPWTARLSCRLMAPPKWDFLTAGDVIQIPVAGAATPFRTERVSIGANGMIEINATQDDPFIYQGSVDFVAASLATIGSSAPVLSIVDTSVYPFNAPILAAAESDTGFSFAANAADDGWRGGALFRSLDGVSFSEAYPLNSRNITGTVASALATGSAVTWDNLNTITVVLDHDDHTLTSATEAEVLAGANAVWLGRADGSQGEVLQFKTATLTTASPPTYDLTGLLRGRRATEHEIDQHVASEIFVLLEPAYLRSVDYSAADIGAQRYYKGVSTGQDEANVVPVEIFTNLGEKARPRSPVMILGSRNGSNDLTITWQRRIRGYSAQLGNSPEPLDEVTESYEIDIIDGSNGVVRTLTATSETVSYTAAQQTTDGLTPGDDVTGQVFQISGTVGRGVAGDFTV